MTSPFRSKKNQKGMSLLMVVMILATLTVTVTTAYLSIQTSLMTGRDKKTEAQIEILLSGLYRYRSHHANTFPATLDNLIVPNNPACAADNNSASPTYRSIQGWCGPYIDQFTQQSPNAFKTDGWGTIFQYNGTELRSCGPNKTCGDADDLARTL